MRIDPHFSLARCTCVSNPAGKRIRLIVLFAVVAIASGLVIASASSGSFRGLLHQGAGASGRGAVEASITPVAANSVALISPVAPLSDTQLNIARRAHTATRLTDGKILIVGGENSDGFVTAAEIFAPATGTFSVSGNLNTPRADHTATLLCDGRVLIAGGRGSLGSLNSTEIFDPTTGVFSSGPDLNNARLGQTATTLIECRIVFVGGDAAGSAEIYDPQANTFSTIGARMLTPRAFHSAAAFSQHVGDREIEKVLIVGGSAPDGSPMKRGEVLDVPSSSFSSVRNELTDEHFRALLHVLPDGKVQIIGGTDHEDMEIYDPAINAFGAHAHVFPSGDSHPELLQQIMDAPTRAAMFRLGASSTVLNRTGQTITELTGSSEALVAGGVDSGGAFLNSASTLNSSAATLTTDKLDYAPGTPVIVSGAGWQPNEFVTLMFHEDPHVNTENPHTFNVQADANGNFVCQEYAPEGQDAGVTYILAAKGGSSGWTAQTGFKDGATYYSQGSLAPNLTTSWNSNRGGGGSSPANFTGGDTFVVQNGHNMTTSASWSISGTGSKLQIENGGTLTATSAVTLATATTFQIDAGGTYVHNNTSAYGSTIFQAGTKSFDPASTVILNNSNTTGPSGVTFGNLTVNFTSDPGGAVNCSGGLSTINGTLSVVSTSTREFRLGANIPANLTTTIAGDLQVSGGTLNLINGTTILTLNVGGNFNQSGGTFTATGPGPHSINFTGTGKSFTQSAGTLTNTNINWAVNSGASLTLANNLPVATGRTLTVNGTLNCGAKIVSGAGNFALSSGATLGIGDPNGITSGTSTSGNIQVTAGTRTFDGSANYTYNGSAAQVTGNGLPTTVNNLTISNSGGVSITNTSVTVNGTLTLTSGSFAVGSMTLVLNGSAIAGTPNNLTTTSSSNLEFGGNSTGISIPSSVSNLSTLTINNTNGVALNGPLTMSSTLTLTNGALSIGSNTLTLSGNLSVSNGSITSAANGTVNYNQSGDGQSVRAFNYGNLTLSNFNKTLLAGTIGIAGTFTPGSSTGHSDLGSTFDFNGLGTQTVPAFQYNNLTISGTRGGATVTLASGTIGIADAFNPSAMSVSYSLTGNTVEYNGTSGTAQTLPTGFLTCNNLTLNNFSGTTGPSGLAVNGLLEVKKGTFTSASVYNDVQIDAAGTLTLSGPTTVRGNWTNNGAFNAGTDGVTFNGDTGQTIGGNTTFYDFTKSVGSPQTLLFGAGSTQTVTHSLTLTGTSGNLLSLRSTVDGNQWNLHAPSMQSVSFVNVKDSNATGGNTVTSTNSTDAVNNVNWSFSAGTLSFRNAPYTDTEANSGTHTATITVQRTGGSSGAVSVHYATGAGTATAGSDYVETAGDLNWADGDLADKTFTVTVKGDTIFEADETVNLTLSSATGGATIDGTNPVTLAITDDDTAPTFAIGDVTQSEGNTGQTAFTFTVTRTGSTQLDSVVTYSTTDGTATSPSDLTSITNGSLTILAGQPSGAITVQVNGDTIYEANEMFTVHISNVSNGSATDADGLGTIVNDDAPAATLVVNTTNDADDGICNSPHCSLREAMNAANFSSDTNTINFDIPTGDPGFVGDVYTIKPTSALPTITTPMTIDGTSQTTISDSNPNGPEIVLNGSLAGSSNGFYISGDHSTIKGFVINGFNGVGVAISYPNDSTPSNNQILNNYIGTNAAGTAAVANASSGVDIHGFGSPSVQASNNTVHGNVISGNTGVGISMCDAGNTTIIGNFIGATSAGASLGNGSHGIYLACAGDLNGTISGNMIAFNGGDGFRSEPDYRFLPDGQHGNKLTQNSIFSNTGLGINLLPPPFGTVDGVTPNDNKDPDIGTNELQNFPVITQAFAGTTNTISGNLNSTPGETFTIEFFTNPSCDGSGNGEGQTYLSSLTTGVTDSNGDVSFTLNPGSLTAGDVVTATATDANGNTSEFSHCLTVVACADPVVTSLTHQTVTYGDGATFTASATGTPAPTLQWQVSTDGGSTWTDISGATTSPLTVTRPTVAQTGTQYRAVFTNACNTVNSSAAMLTVNEKNLTINGAVAQNKVYDGSNSATVDFSGTTLSGVVAPEVVSINSTANVANFDTKNVGNNRPVTVTGVTLSGADAGNYTVSQPSGLTADIAPKSVTASVAAGSKAYDGNANATITACSLTGVIAPDTTGCAASTTAADNQFSDANTGNGKTVTANNISLTDNAAGNYALSSMTATTTANIAKADATITVTPYNVTYDGNPHMAAGTAKGVLNETLSGLDLSGTTHTNAGSYLNDPWTFTDVTGNYNNASGTVDDNISKANTTTIITNTSSLASSSTVVGQSYTVNWSVSVNSPGSGMPTGTVAVMGGSGCSAAVSAGSCTVTSTTAGAKTLVATYTSDTANFNGSTSAGTSHTVNSATTTTAAQDKTVPYGDTDQSVTLTATVSAAYMQVDGGPVTFTVTDSSNVTVGTPVTSGSVAAGAASANYTLPGGTSAGTYTITAAYSGTPDFNGGSGTGTLTVSPGDLLSDTATLDADFKKIDGFDVLFNKIDKSTLLKLENTNPATFHYRLRMTNLTGADLNSDNGTTLRAFIEVPAMADCGGVPCPSTVSTTLPAFSLRNKHAEHVHADDLPDDMKVAYAYKSSAPGTCADTNGYSTTFPIEESPRCIMVSGFALPKKHRAEIDVTFEFRWKKSLNWDQNASLFFFSGFPFKATVQAIFTSPAVTRTGYFTVGLVGAGQRVTAVGGFSFNGLAQPTTGLIVRLFDSTKPVAACSSTTNPVAQDTVNADGFYFIWRKGADQGTAAVNDLPDGVKYVVQICNGGAEVTRRTMKDKLGKKEFDEEDFYGVMAP